MLGKENFIGKVSNSTRKIALIFVIILLFLIPVSLIERLIQDRKDYEREAVSSITRPLGGMPEIQGMLVSIPYRECVEIINDDGKKSIETRTKYLYFAPNFYSLDVDVDTYYLNRGIFKVPVFNACLNVVAEFNNFDVSHFNISEQDVLRSEAFLMIGLSSTKNLTQTPELKIGENTLSMSPVKYDDVSPFDSAVYYNLPKNCLNESLKLAGKINIQGGKNIKIQPIAENNLIKMNSNWSSPSFSGGWLPTEREINADGFSASWKIVGLSTVFPKSWKSDSRYRGELIEVSFIVPVDSYQKTTRSIKYALLFLIIPFLGILVCEIFSAIKIHPVQYCLIGVADVVFYLLLLSLSEHISFNLSYFISAACVDIAALFYASSIFKKVKFGILLSLVQLISYIFLFGTLQAEDYALLIGSIGIFIVVILLMYITRNVDWYGVN